MSCSIAGTHQVGPFFFTSGRNRVIIVILILSCVFNRWIGFHREWRKRVSNLWTNGIVRFVEYLLFAFSLPSLLVISLFAVLALVRTEHWLCVIWLLFYCLDISNLIQCFFSPVSVPQLFSKVFSFRTYSYLPLLLWSSKFYYLISSLNFWRQEIPSALVVVSLLREFSKLDLFRLSFPLCGCSQFSCFPAGLYICVTLRGYFRESSILAIRFYLSFWQGQLSGNTNSKFCFFIFAFYFLLLFVRVYLRKSQLLIAH